MADAEGRAVCCGAPLAFELLDGTVAEDGRKEAYGLDFTRCCCCGCDMEVL